MTGHPCPLCGACAAETVFDRRNVPAHQNVVCETAEDARRFARADLVLAFCEKCGFVFNQKFDSGKLNYSAVYDNSQAHSAFFQRYLRDLCDYLRVKYGLRGKRLVEVGCGKGDFLRLMCAGGMNRGLGFDPSYVGPETGEEGAIRFVKAFYGESHCDCRVDFLYSRHVLEHIQDPAKMLRSMRKALGDDANSVIYIEVPDLAWILDQAAFWDFFYEHCSYFCAGTLRRACQAAGFEVERTFPGFGGQYLCLEARCAPGCHARAKPDPGELGELRARIGHFRKSVEERMQTSRERVMALRERGPCALWGAAAKGTTFANVIDPEARYIRCLIDINPSKRGKFIAGSGHRIIAPEDISACESEIRGIFSMNSNYFEEQRAKLAQLSLNIPLIPL